MKTNKIEECREIGELISEIAESGFFVEMRNPVNGLWKCQLRKQEGSQEQSQINGAMAVSENLTDCLAALVDTIRIHQGKPTLGEEVAALLAKDQEHATAEPIQLGEAAQCRCGSKRPLLLERNLKLEIPWDARTIWLEHDGFMGQYDFSITVHPQKDEILSCPDCGRFYSVSERQI